VLQNALIADSLMLSILEEYERRAEREAKVTDGLSLVEMARRRDEFLLPVGRATGLFLGLLVRAAQARRVIELGTAYGYSTLWLADAVRDSGGHVETIELQPDKVAYARERIERAGLGAYVTFHVSDARTVLEDLAGPFDVVLVDLWKELYALCLDAIYPKLTAGGFIVADNMLEPAATRAEVAVYQRRLRSKPDLESVLLPIGSGIEITRRLI
jgi:predicted O-methyltransferase YrrM